VVLSKTKGNFQHLMRYEVAAVREFFLNASMLSAILEKYLAYEIIALIYLKPRFVVLEASRCQGLFPSPHFQKRPWERG
jgi:hypothetical protein